jgi:hypothetical protein
MRAFQIGTALAVSYDENGMLGVQVDGHGENAAGHGRYSVGSFGIVGRPKSANDDGGALTLYADEGKEGFAWCGFDHRDLTKVPPLTEGSVAVVNSDGAYQLLDCELQTYTLYVPVDDSVHTIIAGKTATGKRIVRMMHANASHFSLNETDSIWQGNGNAFLRIKGDNITANGTFKGGSGDFGGGAGVPLVNAPAFALAVTACVAAFSGGGAPATQAQVAAMLTALAAALSGTAGTTMLKAL